MTTRKRSTAVARKRRTRGGGLLPWWIPLLGLGSVAVMVVWWPPLAATQGPSLGFDPPTKPAHHPPTAAEAEDSPNRRRELVRDTATDKTSSSAVSLVASAVPSPVGTPPPPPPAPLEMVVPGTTTTTNRTTIDPPPPPPYYLTGRSWTLAPPTTTAHPPNDETAAAAMNAAIRAEKIVFKSIGVSPIETIPAQQHGWVLPKRLAHPTRNHGSVLLEDPTTGRASLLVVLGRYSRAIQAIDMITGDRVAREVHGTDPAGNPLGDLNHVYTVVVDPLPKKKEDGGEDDHHTTPRKEIWLPCGFHGDPVNAEESSEYARIVEWPELSVVVGPKLAVAGGACVAAAIEVVQGQPPHVCTFGGTRGNHDTGTFLPYASCYDRVHEKWHHPFGRLPTGLDHGSVAVVPPETCAPSDPARILIFNFRTRNYGTQSPEILAYDLPPGGWTPDQLDASATDNMEVPGDWYVLANITYGGPSDATNAPRDASGMVLAGNGRHLINFGGTHYQYREDPTSDEGTPRRIRRHHTKYSTIRSFDVCEAVRRRRLRKKKKKKDPTSISHEDDDDEPPLAWQHRGDLGAQTFALQSSASSILNVAISCGGHAFSKKNENIPWCFVTRIPGLSFDNDPHHFVEAGALGG